MTFRVFQAKNGHNERKQVLVAADEFDGEISNYFPAGRGYHDFVDLGTVEAIGEAEDELDSIYEAQ